MQACCVRRVQAGNARQAFILSVRRPALPDITHRVTDTHRRRLGQRYVCSYSRQYSRDSYSSTGDEWDDSEDEVLAAFDDQSARYRRQAALKAAPAPGAGLVARAGPAKPAPAQPQPPEDVDLANLRVASPSLQLVEAAAGSGHATDAAAAASTLAAVLSGPPSAAASAVVIDHTVHCMREPRQHSKHRREYTYTKRYFLSLMKTKQ